MDDKALDRLFTGDLDQLVPLPKRVVRLFISSTFTDMMLERNSLMERVYPRLKKYCRERHGLDFQVVDMRWGVRDEATDDHQTANLCSREIDNCQRMSLGPNFVALIGDKYGFRPLCNKIKSTEYRAIRRCLIELDISTDFLDTWYKEDLNAVPAEYLLQPISSILKNFTNKNEPDLQTLDQRNWQAIQQRLHELLMIGSSRLVEQGRMSKQEQLMKYSISVTEREVIEGCLQVKEAKSNCLVYVRSIVDIREQLSKCLSQSAADSIQLSPQPQFNTSPANNVEEVEFKEAEVEEEKKKMMTMITSADTAANNNSDSKDQTGRDSSTMIKMKTAMTKFSAVAAVASTTGASVKNEQQQQQQRQRSVDRMRNLLAKYIDLSSRGPNNNNNIWSLDEEAQNLLGHLRAVKLETKMGEASRALSKFRVLWDESEGISLKSEEHRKYLNELTDHFYMNMTKMIRRASRDDREFKAGLIGEVLQHSHYAKHVSRSFYGRSNELDRIRTYIVGSASQLIETKTNSSQSINNNNNNNLARPRASAASSTYATLASTSVPSHLQQLGEAQQMFEPMPMFVYGVGGSGKTSVLARAATLAKDWIERAKSLGSDGQTQVVQDERWDQKPCIIMRFCCTTPSSSSMVGVLTSVCRQLQYNLYQFGPLNSFMNQVESHIADGDRDDLKATTTNAASKLLVGQSGPNSVNNKSNNNSNSSSSKLEPQLPYEPIPEDFVRLVFTFRQLIENCRHHYHKNRLFLIILDSVERLSSPTESSVEVKYSWLTGLTKLPPNVRLIVSCSSEKELSTLQQSSPEGRRGCGGGNVLDFIHLKRHFLRLYLPLVVGTEQVNGLPGSLSDDLQASERRRLPRSDSSLDAAAMDLAIMGNKPIVTRPRDSLAGNLLKKLVLPAMRLRRGSQKISPLQSTLNLALNSTSQRLLEAAELASAAAVGWPQSTLLKRSVSSLSTRSTLDENPNSKIKAKAKKGGKLIGQGDGSRSPSLSCISQLGSGHQRSPTIDISEREDDDSSRQQQRHRPRQLANKQGPTVNMIHVRPMGVELALNVVRLWLQEIGRTLTQQQWSIARQSFAQCSRPIFVKLTFGEIVNWKSYSVQSDSKGLTFGSSILEGQASGTSAYDRAGDEFDPDLKLLMSHCEPVASSAQFKRQILTMEREWLGFLGYSQRKAEAPSVEMGLDGSNIANSGSELDPMNKLKGSDAHNQKQIADSEKIVQRGWNNALASNICHLSSTIDEAISQLFARIELQHGYLLTKHSLSYITAARNGICENELEDILSLDDVVLDDVFQYHFPPVRRIPPLLWTRIRNDLTDYLSERDADGIVVNWHHNQFKLVAQSRYLDERQQLHYIHSNLADYFMGRWADVPKPFSCTRQQLLMATGKQLESSASGGRDSSTQSSPTAGTSFTGGGGGRFNASSGSASGRPILAGGRNSRLRSSEQSDKSSTNWRQAKADRRVPPQPIYYDLMVNTSASDGSRASDTDHHHKLIVTGKELAKQSSGQLTRRYNLRKLTELPYHLMRSSRFVDLANEVLFNYKWLYAAIDATGLQSLLSDFGEASRCLEAALAERLASAVDGIGETQQQPHPHQQLKLESSHFNVIGRKKNILDADTLKSMIDQLDILNNTIRLSSSSIHLDTQMLAPQLIGRLLPLTRSNANRTHEQLGEQAINKNNYLIKLLDQCDRDGCLDCALLPIDHCLQAPNGLQLSSLEGHSFAILSMSMAADQRHLLAVSNRFIMWDISTGEVSRDVDTNCEGSIMMELKMGLNDDYAIAYTSNNIIVVLDILTQQIVKLNLFSKVNENNHTAAADDDDDENIIGLELVDLIGASKFVVWTKKSWYIMRIDKNDQFGSASMSQRISIKFDYSVELASLELGGYNFQHDSSRDLNIQQVFHDNNTNVTFILISNNPLETMNRNKLHLITIAHSNVHKNMVTWEQRIEAASLCLDPNQRQLVFSNHQGEVFLSRRRKLQWSKPKLIWSSMSKGIGSMNNFNSSSSDSEITRVPLAIELDSFAGRDIQKRDNLHQDNYLELADFEHRVDGVQVDDELEASAQISKHDDEQMTNEGMTATTRSNASISTRIIGSHLRTVLLYFNDRIVVLRLDAKQERSLPLPRDIRNMSVKPNRCQIRAIILGAHLDLSEGFLAASVGRRLLLYSIGSGQFLRSIDAHSGRIVQLMPIVSRQIMMSSKAAVESSLDLDDDRWLSFASASLDKTVKIWNLKNLKKDVHSLDKLDNPIESMSLAKQKPWVACLGRSELGLWDWRTMRLLAKLTQHNLMSTSLYNMLPNKQPTKSGRQTSVGLRLLKCRLSSDGRHLCLATLRSIHLFAIVKDSNASELSSYQLKPCAEHQLPDEAQVRQFRFFQQDSRLLTSVEFPMVAAAASSKRRLSQEDTSSLSSGTTVFSLATARRLHILCHSIPDGRLLYTIATITPTIRQTAATTTTTTTTTTNATADYQSQLNFSANRIRLPVLTRDQLHVVTVESGGYTNDNNANSNNNSTNTNNNNTTNNRPQASASIRKRSSGARLATLLGVYSARDGLLLRCINLDQLEPYNPVQQLALDQTSGLLTGSKQRLQQQQAGHTRDWTAPTTGESSLLNLSPVGAHRGGYSSTRSNSSSSGGNQAAICSIGGDQFSRLKSVASYRERQSIVALLDNESSSSFLVDVSTKQLMANSSIWNGKLSSNGRFGLSRMFKSAAGSLRASAVPSASHTTTTTTTTAALAAASSYATNQTSTTTTTAGLQLLEMGHCKPVKTLLTHETISKLSIGANSRQQQRDEEFPHTASSGGPATGNDTDITCGFAGPNDSHVYYHDSRLAKLLLIRVDDGHLVANYKLSTRVTKIKCSSDGYALVLGLADGSLTSLAIVDPQQDDTVTRLAQYPSRRRDVTTTAER